MSDTPKLTLAPVVTLGCATCLDIDSQRVLNGALEAELSEVVVVGYDKDGEFYFASSKADGPNILWALEMAKLKLLKITMS